MASTAQICSLALARLGAQTIVALTDNTPEAKLCNTLFLSIAEDVMSQGSWSSCVRRASLARTLDTPSYGYTYSYQLPVDPRCLKVLRINEAEPSAEPYAIEGDRLLIDSSSVKILYIANITDTNSWNSYLTQTVVARLAQELSYAIVGNASKSIEEEKRYEDTLHRNLALDGQQGTNQMIVCSDLTRVR